MIFFPWFTIFPRLFFSFKLFLFRNIVLCATGLRKKLSFKLSSLFKSIFLVIFPNAS